MVGRRVRVIAGVIVAAAALWYLRDPSWLAEYRTGLGAWERAADGTRFRWSTAHASFFVPATASSIRIPIATIFDPPADGPMIVTFTVDDVRAARALVTDARWQTIALPVPPPGTRRFRRIDVRTTAPRADGHGVMVGDIQVVGR